MKAKIFSSRVRLFRTAMILLICLMLLLFLLSAPKFEDGFESGFSAWNTAGTSPPITVEDRAHHGRYSARFSSNGGQDNRSYCFRRLSPTSLGLYARGYFYVNESGLDNEGNHSALIMFRAGDDRAPLAYAGWRNADGVERWYLALMNGSERDYIVTISDMAPSLLRWYSVELHWRQDPVNCVAELWVDDVMACSVDGKLASGYEAADTVRFGLAEIVASGRTVLYLDCAAINGSKIGTEPSQRWSFLAVGVISAGIFVATFLASRRRVRTEVSMSQDGETVIY
jgi:hypothetical protein